jgi:hypothetical protein
MGEKRLGRLMVEELFRCVGQHWVIDETIVGEREMLNPFHGKEQPWKVLRKSPLLGVRMSLWFRHRYHLRHPL